MNAIPICYERKNWPAAIGCSTAASIAAWLVFLAMLRNASRRGSFLSRSLQNMAHTPASSAGVTPFQLASVLARLRNASISSTDGRAAEQRILSVVRTCAVAPISPRIQSQKKSSWARAHFGKNIRPIRRPVDLLEPLQEG